jgi:glucose/arabinose dehydrogenase
MVTMNDLATPAPRHPHRPRRHEGRHRLPAIVGGSVLLAAILAPGSAVAGRPPHVEGAAAPGGAAAGSGSVAAVAPLGTPTGADIKLTFVVGNLNSPVFITPAGDGTNRLFIVEKTGRIKIWNGSNVRSRPFLSLAGKVSTGSEQGLLGLAFHPNFEENRKLYVNFTNLSGDTVIRQYKTYVTSPNRVNPNTAKLILRINQPFSNHNGGGILFGPGGYLYIGTGDGGDSGDPGNRAQRIDTLLGKMLRINVNGTTADRNYLIPSGNPYIGQPGKDEIWQRGLRNPWRWSFDRANGNLWIGDVGQGTWEEIDRATNGSSGPGRGINWGWRVLEGSHCFNPPSGCSTSGKTMPVTEYRQTDANGRCAVTGGYVYRGNDVPALVGGYVFGDFCSGEIFVIPAGAATGTAPTRLLNSNALISSFGQRADGELFVVDLGGRIYRIARA